MTEQPQPMPPATGPGPSPVASVVTGAPAGLAEASVTEHAELYEVELARLQRELATIDEL